MKRGIFVLVSLILLVSLVDATYTRVKDTEINGSIDGLLTGYSLASGDFNNDFVDDLVVGKYSDNGAVYLFFGDPVTGIVNQTVDTPNVTFSNSGGLNSKFGRCVMMVDFNNDSVKDVVIASSQSDVNGDGTIDGLLTVYYGGSDISNGRSFGASEWNMSIKGVQNMFNLNYLCNENNELDSGDLNNDSIGDIVVGNNYADLDGISSTHEGQVYVFFGFNDPTRTGYTLNVSDDANITINGSSFISSNYEGLSAVDVIPDTNGDGIDDLLIGGDGTYSAFASSGGAAYIFFGEQNSGGFNYQANNSANVTFNGDVMNLIGLQVTGGDFNNDSLSDIAIGSTNGSGCDGGQIGLFYSSPNWLEIPVPLGGISYNFSDANLTVNGSYTIVTTVDPKRGGIVVTLQNQENLGSDRMKILDINNDSIKDLVINSLDARPYDNYELTYDNPSIYSVYGNTDNNSISMLSNETNLTILGHYEYGNNGADNFGIDFVDIDTNNDTTKELAIGVYYAYVYTPLNLLAGKTYFYNWEDDSVAPEITISTPVNYYNFSASSLDLNVSINDLANRVKSTSFILYQYVNLQWEILTSYTPNMALEYGLWNATIDFTDLNETNYYVKVSSDDEVGNINSTEKIYFTYDKTNPSLIDAFAVTTSGHSGDTFDLNFSGTDGAWNRYLDTVQFLLQSTDEDGNLTINADFDVVQMDAGMAPPTFYYNSTWDSTGYPTGTYFFDVLINDSAGNSREYENYFIITLVSEGVTAESYQNNSINMTANTTEVIDDSANTGIKLNLITTDTVNDSSVSIISYSNNVENSTRGFGAIALGRYFSIVVSPEINGNLSSDTEIRVYYTDEEVAALGVDESTLLLYRFNDTTSQWEILSPSGVDTVSNYIWGRVSSFSSFGASGSALSSSSVGYDGSGGSSGTAIVKSGEVVNVDILRDVITEARMDEGATISFTYNGGLHNINIKDVNSELNIVTLKVESDPQILNIQIGKTMLVDLDNDNVMDIEIYVKNIIGTKAYLEFKGLSVGFNKQRVVVDNPVVKEESSSELINELSFSKKSNNGTYILFSVLFILIIVLIVKFYKKQEKYYPPKIKDRSK